MSTREMKELRRRLVREGFVATITGSNHWRIMHPNMEGVVFMSNSPSDGMRTRQNVMAEIRRRMKDPERFSL